MVLRQVQDDLEKEGFQVQCLVIPASGIGAWHQRKRVWIIAYSEHNGSHRSKGNETIESSNQSKEWLFIGDDKDVTNSQRMGWQERSKESKEFKGETTSNKSNNSIERQSIRESSLSMDVSNSNIEGLEGHELQSDNEQQRQKTSTDSSTEEQCTWWQAQSSLCGVPNGISYELDKSRANRIKSLGNSIVPLIARELGVAIMKAEQDG